MRRVKWVECGTGCRGELDGSGFEGGTWCIVELDGSEMRVRLGV